MLMKLSLSLVQELAQFLGGTEVALILKLEEREPIRTILFRVFYVMRLF